MTRYAYDLVVIGAGSGGLLAAEVAREMRIRCAVVERDRVGGDCLWTGCVPSKALIASARAAHIVRNAAAFGLDAAPPQVDTARVWARIHEIQRTIAETDDNPAKFAGTSVDVIFGDARLVDGHSVDVGGRRLTTKFVLIATGSRPTAPPIEGLEETGYLTSENVFDLERAPSSLMIVGGGPVAVELAQAHQRLGVPVTVLEREDRILSRDEPSLAARLLAVLRREGVDVQLGAELTSASRDGAGKTLRGAVGGEQREWRAEEILVAAGRRPNIDGLGLDEAGVHVTDDGISVDERMRTSVPSVYACGDVAGRYLFTHSAASEAVTALRNMFFPLSQDASSLIPWCTFTDPELAHIGMTGDEARRAHGRDAKVFRRPLERNDRARAESATDGEIVVVTDAKHRIVGAHVLAPAAGEMIGQFVLAIDRGVRLTPELANQVQVYPTVSTAISQLAGDATYPQLRAPFLRTLRKLYGVFR